MEVKTGVLRDQLSRYLKRVKQTGDTVIVLDRDEPIAEIRPYQASTSSGPASVWESRRQFEQQSGALTEDFELPERSTSEPKHTNPLD
jgi:antitoxin (DNA-binding transcriptional repressor) of toxin-antitoxin stability system